MVDSDAWWWWSNGMSDGHRGKFISPFGWSVIVVIAVFVFLFALVFWS